MIQNLNHFTFSEYGDIYTLDEYKQYKGIKKEPSKTLQFTEASPLFFTGEHQLFLDVIEYPTLLEIMYEQSSLSAQNYDIFLLDKPVRLNAKTYFRLVPMHSKCTVEFYPGNLSLNQYFYSVSSQNETAYFLNIPKIYVAFYQEKEKGFYFKGEHHPCWELTYVDSGEMYSIVDNQKYLLRQGDCTFYGPNQHHIQYAAQNVSVNFFSIAFDMELKKSDMLLNQVFQIQHTDAALLNKIISESTVSQSYSGELMICYLKEFLILLFRALDKQSPVKAPDSHLKQNLEKNIVGEVCNYIEENIFSPITVADIAHHINLSVPYLSTLFHRQKEIRLIEYIRNRKLEKSKELIRSGQYTITQISEMLGYSSIHYFSRIFKATYNISPSEYSKALR